MNSTNIMLTNADGNPEIFEETKSVMMLTEDGTFKEFVDPANGEHLTVKVTKNGVVVVQPEEGQLINSVTVETDVEGEAVVVQANWNQTDPEKPDYIKNKPKIPEAPAQADWAQLDANELSFIKNRPFGPIPDVITERELNFVNFFDEHYISDGDIRAGDVKDGERYTVTWDGNVYSCRAYRLDSFIPALSGEVFCLGNQTLFWGGGLGVDTGEPFIIMLGDGVCALETDDPSPTHTVGVRPVKNFVKIDKSWLPDDIGGGGSISISAATTDIDLFAEQEVTFHVLDEGDDVAITKLDAPVTLVAGNMYFVVLDEVEYELKAKEVTLGEQTGIILGDYDAFQSGDFSPQLPFCLASGEGNGEFMTMMVLPCEVGETVVAHTVRIYEKKPGELKTIEYDFGKHGVPEVSFYNEMFGMTFYKISSELPTKEQLDGASFYSNYDEGENPEDSFTLTPDYLMIEGDEFIGYGTFAGRNGGYAIGVAYSAGTMTAQVMGTDVEVEIPEAGIYVPYDGTNFDTWYVKLEYFVESSFKLQADWNESNPNNAGYIANRPFYDDSQKVCVLEPSTLPFSYAEGDGYAFVTVPTEEMLEAWNSTWDEAEVVWDGQTYTCPMKTISVFKGCGNSEYLMNAGDSGEPFCVFVQPKEVTGNEADTVIIFSPYDNFAGEAADAPTVYHSFGISLNVKNLKKIDAKFLHQPDWNDSDTSSPSFIHNKPFGTVLEKGHTILDVTATYDEADNWFMLDTTVVDWDSVIPGTAYEADIGGNRFVGKAMTTYEGMIATGGLPASGIGFTDDNGDFVAGLVSYMGIIAAVMFRSSQDAQAYNIVSGNDYDIKIWSCGYDKQVDYKYLPFGQSLVASSEVLEDCDMMLGMSSDTAWMYSGSIDSRPASDFEMGKPVSVSINGVEHILPTMDFDGSVMWGNFDLLLYMEGMPVSVTESDFLIMAKQTYDGETTTITGYDFVSLRDLGNTVHLTISECETVSRPIPVECVPEPKMFDFYEMGLPVIPLSGTYVEAICDVAEFRKEAAKGLVKVAVVMDVSGYPMRTETVGGMIYIPALGVYSSMTMAIFNNIPFAVEVIVTNDRIQARALPLATPAT